MGGGNNTMTMNEHPVFEAPDRGSFNIPNERPVDLVHLARQTGGDRSLEEEVLRLFVKQAHSIGRAMRERTDADARKRAAHTLKGAARAVGAGGVADCAHALEGAPDERGCIKALLAEIDTTCDYINSLLR